MSKSHKCYDGKIFADSKRTRMVPCPICQQERKDEARNGVLDDETGKKVPLAETLGLSKRFVSDIYNSEYIIGKADIYYLEKETLREFNEQVEKLVSNLIMGVLPSTSLVMYLGRHARLQEFAYILLASAHKGVKTVGKILTAREIRLNKYEDEFKDHYTNDLEIVIATDDVDSIGFTEIQGFMQERSYNNKPTVILLSNKRGFTTMLGRLCSLDSPRLDLGAYLGVSYKRNLSEDDSELIARKAFEVANDSLGTSMRLDNHYTKPSKLENETISHQNGRVKTSTENIEQIDLDSLTNNRSFNGNF